MPIQFDDAQERLIAHKTGNAVGLAGAGSGKTACVTERIARRHLDDEIPLNRILALTFTNKACAEMVERVGERLRGVVEDDGDPRPPEARKAHIVTFHKLGHQLIIRGAQACRRNKRPSLMDEKDPIIQLRACLLEEGFGKADEPIWRRAYEMIRSDGLNPFDPLDEESIMAGLARHAGDFSAREHRRLLAGFRAYDRIKERFNLLDFDDLITLPAYALRNNPRWRKGLQEWFIDITVDEAQDNNLAQYKLVSLLMREEGNVLMVGDDDQSVHRWRGARPDILRMFIEEKGAVEYRLEANYRSTPEIVDPATNLIRNNRDRLEKNPYATRESQDAPIRLHTHDTGIGMADVIAKALRQQIDSGVSPDDLAILYRVNRMAGVLEPALIREGVPYRIKAGTDLMSRVEIKMLLAAGRLAANPIDAQAFERLCKLLPGVGPKVVETIMDQNEAIEMGLLPYGAMKADVSRRARESLQILNRELGDLYHAGPSALLDWAKRSIHFRKWMEKEAARQVNARIKAQDEVADVSPDEVSARIEQAMCDRMDKMFMIQQGIDARIGLDRNLEDQWATAMEILLQAPDENPGRPAVMLCTVHGAKGLQWSHVHVAGFSDGIMPYRREENFQEIDPALVREQQTEERCLAYVALTRAEDQVHLHHAETLDLRMGKGPVDYGISPYVREIGEEHLHRVEHRKSAIKRARARWKGAPGTARERDTSTASAAPTSLMGMRR